MLIAMFKTVVRLRQILNPPFKGFQQSTVQNVFLGLPRAVSGRKQKKGAVTMGFDRERNTDDDSLCAPSFPFDQIFRVALNQQMKKERVVSETSVSG